MAPQWFIRLLDYKDEFLKRSEQLQWYPDYMKVRLDDWVNGLKYDWNIYSDSWRTFSDLVLQRLWHSRGS